MIYIFFLLNLVIITLLLARWSALQIKSLPRAAVPLLFVLKVIAGYLLSQFYLRVYQGGDMHGYLSDAETLYRYSLSDKTGFIKVFAGVEEPSSDVAARLKSWFGSGYDNRHHDARTVIRFHTLVRFISGGNEWVHLLWSNLAALLGYIMLLRFFFDRELKESGRFLILLLFPALLPNVLLWSSSVLKEPLLMLAMGGTFYSLKSMMLTKKLPQFVILLLFVFLFSMVKSFWLVLLLPALAAYAYSFGRKNSSLSFFFAYAIALVLAISAGMLIPEYHVPGLLYGEQRNMWRFSVFMQSGSLIHPLPFAPQWSSVLIRTPMALANGLFQPFPANIRGLSYLPTLLENMVLPCLLLMLLFKGRIMRLRGAFPQFWLAFWGGLGIVAVSAFTTPVLGSLVRYRMPGLLLLVMGVLLLLFRSRRLPDT
jgi:hypothetical protein